MPFDQSAETSVDGQDITPASVQTPEAEVTNETLIVLDGESTIGPISAGQFRSPDWKAVKDERGEMSGNQYEPDRGGWYWVSAYAEISGHSDGDEFIQRFYNVTDSSAIEFGPSLFAKGTDEQGAYPFVRLVNLDSGDSYEFQVTNSDSQYSISGGQCGMAIRSAFRDS